MVWIDMGQIIIITICLFTCISFQLFKYPMLSISMRRPGVYLWKTFSDNHRHFYFIAFSSEFHRIVFICSIISVLNLIQAFTSCVLQIFCKMIVVVVVVVVLGCVYCWLSNVLEMFNVLCIATENKIQRELYAKCTLFDSLENHVTVSKQITGNGIPWSWWIFSDFPCWKFIVFNIINRFLVPNSLALIWLWFIFS